MIKKIVCFLYLILFLAMGACTATTDSSLQPGENHTPTPSPDLSKMIFFPRQEKTEGERAVMEALTRGTLILTDNCIRLERGESLANYLLIWPPDFNFTIEDDTIKILNSENEIVASIGDRVQMGGGEVHILSQLDKFIQEQVPSQCPGPYWIIGEGFTRINP
jgi:hypothetical protein